MAESAADKKIPKASYHNLKVPLRASLQWLLASANAAAAWGAPETTEHNESGSDWTLLVVLAASILFSRLLEGCQTRTKVSVMAALISIAMVCPSSVWQIGLVSVVMAFAPVAKKEEDKMTGPDESDDGEEPVDDVEDTAGPAGGADQAPPPTPTSTPATTRRPPPMKIHIAMKKGTRFHLVRGCSGLNGAEVVRDYTPCRICGRAYQVEALQRDQPGQG